jgi:hypothetical protein
MKRYTLFIALIGATLTVSAHNKNEAFEYARHTLSLRYSDAIVCIGINL